VAAGAPSDPPRASSFWTRHELAITLAVVSTLVVLRSLVFAIFEHAYFDSDQAIIGLMAKHLSEGRAFPLFFYGQPFMLAVEAWWMVPFFWIGGPTVASLRASLIATNLIAAALLVVGLVRHGGVRPALAGVATLFFTFLPPYSSAHLVEAQGGNAEPFVWVLLLWFVRARPLVFGAILAVGFLNREFSAYAAPVLVIADLLQRRLWRPERIRHWLLVGVAFVMVFELVQSLGPYADLKGPGSQGTMYGDSQLQNLTSRGALQPDPLAWRVAAFARDVFGALVGLKKMDTQGHDWLFWPMLAAFVLVAARVLRLATRPGLTARVRTMPFAWYLLGLGVFAAVVVVLVRPIDGMPFRYLLLTLLAPIGLTAALFALEPRVWIRRAVVAAAVGWAAVGAGDHVREFRRFATGAEPDYLRPLADALVARGVTVADAPYWRAYKITFLARERVKVHAFDFMRIDEYGRLANEEGDKLRRIAEQPCEGGEEIAGFFLCPIRH
jgi:hypothetical protein